MNMNNTLPPRRTFLYPTSRQFPIDAVCENIVRELEKRNWSVPGIEVRFHEYGSGEALFRKVDAVKGTDFSLNFSRGQGMAPDTGCYADCAAIDTLAIPNYQLCIHEDESGPTLYLYVGNDWNTDKTQFMKQHSKVNSKLKGEPRK